MPEDPNELGRAGGALKWKLLNAKQHLDPWEAGAGCRESCSSSTAGALGLGAERVLAV